VRPRLALQDDQSPGEHSGWVALRLLLRRRADSTWWVPAGERGLDNDCSDLVSVTATILFGGTVVYKSKSLAVGPSGKTGEKGAVIPKVTDPAIAAAVYRIGTQTLDLRIDASGNDPGPYHATATMNGGREYR
jgi:hypothetical protein